MKLKSMPRKKAKGLNLVALMDIFTVLVFFLIFNIHDEQAVTVKVVNDLPISEVAKDELLNSANVSLLEILSEQEFLYDGVKYSDVSVLENRCDDCRWLAIIAPRKMHYGLIDDVVLSAREHGYEQIFLVVRAID